MGDAVFQEGCVGELVSDGVARLCLLLMLSPTESFHMQTTPKKRQNQETDMASASSVSSFFEEEETINDGGC